MRSKRRSRSCPGHSSLSASTAAMPPYAVKLKEFIQSANAPMVINYRVNAGFLPTNHWLHDPAQGGGRIIGEGCHFIDLCTFFTGQNPVSAATQALPDGGQFQQDNCSITLRYPDGSIAVIHYLANGNKNFPKERIEVFAGGRIAVLDDFRTAGIGHRGKAKHPSLSIEPGQGSSGFLAEFSPVRYKVDPTDPL